MNNVTDFQAFRAHKIRAEEKAKLPKQEVIVYTDTDGRPQCVPYGQPVTFAEWDKMPGWAKGLYRCP